MNYHKSAFKRVHISTFENGTNLLPVQSNQPFLVFNSQKHGTLLLMQDSEPLCYVIIVELK